MCFPGHWAAAGHGTHSPNPPTAANPPGWHGVHEPCARARTHARIVCASRLFGRRPTRTTRPGTGRSICRTDGGDGGAGRGGAGRALSLMKPRQVGSHRKTCERSRVRLAMRALSAAVRSEVAPVWARALHDRRRNRTVAVNENGMAVQLASRPAAMQTYDSLIMRSATRRSRRHRLAADSNRARPRRRRGSRTWPVTL
jgi:hypothetical protein